jgi:ABC-2 type transport system permease protein
LTSPAIVPLNRPHKPALFARRLWAIGLRHIYLHTGSLPRLLEMLYWPLINMMVWGFVGIYINQRISGVTSISQALIAAVLLIEILQRVNQNVLTLFMEEIWSRNLGHLFASPLGFYEYVFGLLATALVRSAIAVIPAICIASYLFHFSLWALGWMLPPYVAILALNGCWYGMLIMALLLRFGMAAEWLGWMATQLLVPLIAPYYPVAVLPPVMQIIAKSIPATYVFEDMKAVIAGQPSNPSHLGLALALNALYLVIALGILTLSYRGARQRGGLLQVGE